MQIIKETAESFDIDLEDKNDEFKLLNTGFWNGSPLEFIQLFQSLINIEKILPGKLSHQQVINNIATMMRYSLSKSNHTSLSRAIHTNNTDYKPDIFNKIEQGYKMIVAERQKAKKIKKTV